jgi:hypothetical protein
VESGRPGTSSRSFKRSWTIGFKKGLAFPIVYEGVLRGVFDIGLPRRRRRTTELKFSKRCTIGML